MSELNDSLTDMRDEVRKVSTEMLGKLDELTASLKDKGKLSAADRALIEEIQDGLQAMDAAVPDTTDTEPETPAPTPQQPADITPEPAPQDPADITPEPAKNPDSSAGQ